MRQKQTLQKTVLVKTKVVKSRHTIRISQKRTDVFKKEIKQYLDSNGFLSWSASKKKYIILGTNEPKNGLVSCPECKLGQLMVIRSKKTRKRFMGCSNYYNGCKASAPLLQKAKLRSLRKACEDCGWPIVLFRYSRKQKWTRQCSNHNCKTRKPIS